jgi:hypothetical protein
MDQAIEYIKNKMDCFLGWLEVVFHKESNYKYLIDSISLNEAGEGFTTIINYKIVGCRNLQRESAINLNSSSVFSSFRADHAQMIVSIATVESLLGQSPNEILEKFQKYVSYCSLKINRRS